MILKFILYGLVHEKTHHRVMQNALAPDNQTLMTSLVLFTMRCIVSAFYSLLLIFKEIRSSVSVATVWLFVPVHFTEINP